MEREGQELGAGGPLGPQESYVFYVQSRRGLLRI